jgi:hypothetical protein
VIDLHPLQGGTFGSTTAGFPISFPGVFGSGLFDVHSTSDFWGTEVNAVAHVVRDGRWHFGLLAGVRNVDLYESLTIHDSATNIGLQGGNGGFFFLGGHFVAPGSSHAVVDEFRTFNHFYGGQLGATVERRWGRLSFEGGLKLAVGASVENETIVGFTSANPAPLDITAPGAGTGTGSTVVPFVSTVATGGNLTSATSIGKSTRSVITVVPEANVQVSYAFASWVRAFVGYSGVYWGNVIRPGDQIDILVNTSNTPSGAHFTGTVVGQPYPRILFKQSDFWAQGVNFGLDLRY